MRRFGPGGFGGGFEGFNRGAGRQQGSGAAEEYNFDDLSSLFGNGSGFGSFADIFSSIFGEQTSPFGTRGGRQSKQPMQGNDLTSEIEVPFETAVNGGKINIHLDVTEQCPVCHGSGSKPGSKPRVCPECQGRGTISYVQGNFAVSRPCPRCLGRGQIMDEPCSNCQGSGSVTRPREIAVTIPAGIESGKAIRLRGLGNPGANGGPPGDLYLKVNVTGHHFFWRDGLDIHCRVPISIAQAVSGTKIRIRTITGQKVEVKIPPGTSTGAKLKLKSLGLSINGRKGDLIVEVDIKVPEKMNEQEKKLFDEMAEKIGLKK
jgi:molecular chaperone DnaJ